MAFLIQKGGSFQISKGIFNLGIGCKWDPQLNHSEEEFDIDVHAFALRNHTGFDRNGSHALTYANVANSRNPDGLLVENSDGSFQTRDGSMHSRGDNKTGETKPGEDAEYLTIFTQKLPKEIDEIALYITIHDAVKRKQNFGRVRNAKIHIDDAGSHSVLAKYDLSTDFPDATCVHVGSFLPDPSGGGWSFQAADSPSNASLYQVLEGYKLV